MKIKNTPWQTVAEENKQEYYESQGNVVVLPEGHLAVLRGLKNMIVVESDNVLLVCPKEDEQQIRQIVMDVETRFDGQYN